MPNSLRRLCADAIRSNAGYSRHYESFPLSWEVGLYDADLSLDNIYKVMLEKHGYQPPPTDIEWDPNDQWSWAQEDMCDNLFHANDAYCTYSPATAKRYGLDYYRFPKRYVRRTEKDRCYYPAGKDGWKLENPYVCKQFDVEFGLEGRGGKHLVIRSFEGRKLEGLTSKDLADKLMETDGSTRYYGSQEYSNYWCRNLLAMIDEWDKCFTSKIASDELEYLAAFRLYHQLEEKASAWREALAEARQARETRRLAAVLAAPMEV